MHMSETAKCSFGSICSRSVILKVGKIAPLGAISKDKGAKKTKGVIGGQKIMKGAKTLIDR